MFLLNLKKKQENPLEKTFTIQNVPIKSNKIYIDTLKNAGFTIQNVPIK